MTFTPKTYTATGLRLNAVAATAEAIVAPVTQSELTRQSEQDVIVEVRLRPSIPRM